MISLCKREHVAVHGSVVVERDRVCSVRVYLGTRLVAEVSRPKMLNFAVRLWGTPGHELAPAEVAAVVALLTSRRP